YASGRIKGLVETVTDELGNVTTCRYTASGDLATLTTATGESLAQTTDALGRVTRVENRDAQGRTLKTLKLSYDDADLPQSVALWLDNQSEAQAYVYRYEYDHLGRETKVTNPLNHATSSTYDANGLLATITYPTSDGSIQQTRYTYSNNDLLIQVALSAQVAWRITYDPAGRVISVTDPRQAVTTTTYEQLFAAGRPYPTRITTTYPRLDSQTPQETSSLVSDASGRLLARTNRAGQRTTFAYTSRQDSVSHTNERVVTLTLPLLVGQTSAYTTVTVYDALARQVSYQNEAQQISTIAYSTQAAEQAGSFNLVSTVSDALHNQQIQVSDANGRLLSSARGRDPVSAWSTYTYDVLGRLTLARTRNAGGTRDTVYGYSYAAASQAVRVSIGSPDSGNAPLIQEYNALNQLVTDNVTTRTYTPRGQLASWRNGRAQTLSYSYDAAGRLNGVTFPDNSQLVHTLDENGNRLATGLRQGDGPVQPLLTRTFDVFNRLSARSDLLQGSSVGYSYTPLDSVQTLTYPDRRQVLYAYDPLGRLQTVTAAWNNRRTSYSYTPVGLLSEITFPNGSGAHYTYDAAGRLQSLMHTRGSRLLSGLTYSEIDALGNRRAARLILPARPASRPASTTTFHSTPTNQLATLNGQNVGYDADGNLTSLPAVGELPALTLVYDASNRVVSANGDSSTYDADGLRVQTESQGLARQYVYDVRSYVSPHVARTFSRTIAAESVSGARLLLPFAPVLTPAAVPGEALDRVLLLRDGHGQPLTYYVYGLGLISQEAGDGSNFRVYHADSVGSTIALSDEHGQLTDSMLYDPYGKLLAHSGNTSTPFLYDGRDGVMSDANGLYALRARFYQADTLRFLQADLLLGDLWDPQTLNRYLFARGNPVSLSDPLGLDRQDSLSLWWVAAGALLLGSVIAGGIAAAVTSGGAATIGSVLPASSLGLTTLGGER
ncbi:MAG TPA: RHS repeat-associated core domain-containing protein, partial [Ktedonobacteraceae bacterium]